MIAEKITGASNTLRGLAGQVHEEVWELIRVACAELEDAAEQAKNLETLLPIAGTGAAAHNATPRA